jgi:5-methylcytosine-specific restriction endonuclease McrA
MEWKRVRLRVIESSSVCHLCGRRLVPDAPPRSRWSTEVDHVVPVAELQRLHPADWWELALNPANLRTAHQWCNRSKGAGQRRWSKVKRGQSRDWFDNGYPGARRTSRTW